MKDISEVRYFQCKCSFCGKTTQNDNGLKGLLVDGWIETREDIYCPTCADFFHRCHVEIGDTVVSNVSGHMGLKHDTPYVVCDIPKDRQGSIYVDVGNGWQARLDIGEYLLL